MTKKEFKSTRFSKGMKAIYRRSTYLITACNFDEYLLELTDDENDCIWVRCENIELVESKNGN